MADVAATVAPNINANGTPSTASSGDADELTVTTLSLVENVGVDDKSGGAVTDLVSSAASPTTFRTLFDFCFCAGAVYRLLL